MGDFNKVFLLGRLARDPEIRYTQNGSAIANMTVATDESFTGSDGNKVERTEWHRVTVFGKAAENCGNYLGKGSLVHVEGSLQTRKWQDKNGENRYATEVVVDDAMFVDSRNESPAGGAQNYTPDAYNAPSFSTPAARAPNFEELKTDDDLPF